MSGTVRRIVVLCGGASAERDVSLQSGEAVAAALRERGHVVRLLDPDVDGLEDIDRSCVDAVIPMVHGTGAEDGTLQRRLQRLRLPFVGSAAEPSELTFDKIRCQDVLRRAGLPVPDSVVLQLGESPESRLPAIQDLGWPVVVKPSRQGSSVGVSIVPEPALLADAVRVAAAWDAPVLLERYIPGRELSVPVINGRVFPCVEIVPAGGWYDYFAKYLDDRTTYAVAPEGVPESVGELARDACAVCQVSAIARVDLRFTDGGDCRILEVNTIPGMTSHSLVPMSLAHTGVSTGEILEELIEDVMRRDGNESRTAA